VGENKKQGGMEIGWFLFVEFDLSLEIISRIIKGMNFIHPEGFLVKGVESQGKTDEETEKEDKNFFSR
jgi:hypothetical protein